MSITLELTGQKELMRFFDDLPKRLSKKVMVKAFRKAAVPLVKEAKRRAPMSGKKTHLLAVRHSSKGIQSTKFVKKRKGELKRSIGIIVGKGRSPAVYVGPKYGDSAKANDAWYAHFIEFGTVKQRAQPFMRPAYQATKGRMLDTISYVLSHELKKVKTAK